MHLNMAGDPSIWTTKPWWCQPWSIVLTGVVITLSSWILFPHWWSTGLVAVVVLGWWTLFLVLVPWSYRQGIVVPEKAVDDP